MKKLFDQIGRGLFGKVLPRWSYPVLKGPLKGCKFILGTFAGDGGGGKVYFNMIEPEQTTAFIKTLKQGNIVFDVGANVGYYTVLGSKLVGDTGMIISLEPFVRNLAYLHQHVALNKLKNVMILPAACSDNSLLPDSYL